MVRRVKKPVITTYIQMYPDTIAPPEPDQLKKVIEKRVLLSYILASRLLRSLAED
jgi:hypothetical protein